MLEYALKLAERGWYVFPCRERDGEPFQKDGEMITPLVKRPYTAKGLYDATNNTEKIKEFWGKYPNALIGVNCEMSGLFVVDVDIKNNVDGIGNWIKLEINESGALHSKTPSGGMHVIWKGIGKTTTNGETGIDTRGSGGYFIAPPSEILSGDYSGKYITLDDWDRQPEFIPDGLMEKLFPTKPQQNITKNIGGRKQLSRTTLEFVINGAIVGERNSNLFKALVDFAGCGYTKEETRDKCIKASQLSGLPDTEFEDTLRKAYSKERTPSIPESIQEKIAENAKPSLIASVISDDESLVIEEAVLSGMMIDNTVISKVKDILSQREFQNSRYGRMYITMIRLDEDGISVDAITLYDELSKIDNVDMHYLETLSEKYPVVLDHILSYAQVVKERCAIRDYLKLLEKTHEDAKKGLGLDEIMSKFSKKASDIAIRVGNAADSPLNSEQAVEVVLERQRAIKAGEIVQRKTGFIHYDKNGGFFIPELIMVAARTGEGKSALLLSLANNMAITMKIPVGFFTLEMSTNEVMSRLITQLTGIEYKKVYTGTGLKSEEWISFNNALTIIKNSPFYFHDPSGINVNDLKVKMRRLKDEKGVDTFFVDQLEQIHPAEGGSDPEYIKINRLAYELKDITKELNVTVFLAHQLNRNITDRKIKEKDIEPELSDLSQAGEKPVHQAWGIVHRRFINEKGKKEISQSKIKVMKNRNGAPEDFAVQFIGNRMLFSNPVGKVDETFLKEPDYLDNDPNWSKD
jgi:replicative DNA helicase